MIATQNSLDQVSTSPLPEAQLDRFLMRLSLGFPDRASERVLLGVMGLIQVPTACPSLIR